nr:MULTISPECIES: YibE/F family protein [unclassified Enterococcus]
MQKKITIIIAMILGCLLASWGIQRSTAWYSDPIMLVQQVTVEDHQQIIHGEIMNTEQKGERITLAVPYQKNQINVAHVKEKQMYLIQSIGDEWQLGAKKNDGWLFLVTAMFIGLLLLVGGRHGGFVLGSMLVNIALLLFLLHTFTKTTGISLLAIMTFFIISAVVFSVVALDGWNKSSLIKITATITSVFLSFGICYIAMDLLEDQGLRYEELNYLTRPYRSVFLSSLLIGTAGGTLDTVVTVIATLEELVEKQPAISLKQLWLSGRKVGQDVIGSMTNVLLFVYISGAIPSLLLYLGNGWSVKETMEVHLSLELLRAIIGSLGIVLSIPIALLCFLSVRRGKI